MMGSKTHILLQFYYCVLCQKLSKSVQDKQSYGLDKYGVFFEKHVHFCYLQYIETYIIK